MPKLGQLEVFSKLEHERLEVEQQRLQLERQRLKVEEERLQVERSRLQETVAIKHEMLDLQKRKIVNEELELY